MTLYYLFEVILEMGFIGAVNKNQKGEGIEAKLSIFRESRVHDRQLSCEQQQRE